MSLTLYSLLSKLQAIVEQEPQRGKLPVCVYISEEALVDGKESPHHIHSIDNSIGDRIDINV